MTSEIMDRVRQEILEPAVKGMATEGHPYKGLLYAGLMVKDGVPRVVEFNCRFGDPETQPLMLMLDEDLLDLCYRSATGTLEDRPLKFHSGAAITVVIAADGYPGSYQKDIDLGELSLEEDNPVIFHAGTRKENGRYLSTGGRILNITGRGKDHEEARQKVYEVVERLNVAGVFYRKDIGLKHS
jgi:phosphoribosylamine--glycine ligase